MAKLSLSSLISVNEITIAEKISPEKFQKILSYPIWNKVTQLFSYTRSYELGLEFGVNLSSCAESFQGLFSAKEQANQLILIYSFILSNLDRLDRWEDYIRVWEQIRGNTQELKFTLTYSKNAKKFHGNKIDPFVLKKNKENMYVHFLYSGFFRLEKIKGKLAKKKQGKKIGNLLHAQQSELSKEEVMERFYWILEYLETGEYDFDPPASKQRAKRKKEKDDTIDV